MVPLSFAGHDLMALPEGALYWPARRALLVADLHFEKASWFAARGQMLPPYDSIATLSALAALVERTGAAELWCLGDSFHDSAGCERLPGEARALLTGMTARLDWHWITGNHDPVVEPFGGRIAAEAAGVSEHRPRSRGTGRTRPDRPAPTVRRGRRSRRGS